MAKILLVDDAAFMRMMVKDTLTKAGYTDLYEAADGLQAVETYAEIQPDLVIMDVSLPYRNGLAGCRRLFLFRLFHRNNFPGSAISCRSLT